jgi:hypothetical protein
VLPAPLSETVSDEELQEVSKLTADKIVMAQAAVLQVFS